MENYLCAKKTAITLALVITFTFILLAVAVAFILLYNKYEAWWMRMVYITLITCFYHFAMRLSVGETVTLIYKNRQFNPQSPGFRLYKCERRIYKILKVKKWIKYAITAKPEQFDLSVVTPEELYRNMLQAELVHKITVVLSYIPLLFIIPFGSPAFFIITSVLASLVDLEYVIIQRYNRPRVERFIKSSQSKNA